MVNKKFLKQLKKSGVKVLCPNSTIIDSSCKIGKNTIIYPNNIILNHTIIGENCVLIGTNYIENCVIGNDNRINYSFMANSKIGNENLIGPFSRLREAQIENKTKIGNFVEIKKSAINNGVKASHLTYVGDSEVGTNTNIGCGVIFCNYNGKEKFKTVVGKNCFIGSNVNLIAPISVGDNSFISAGVTLNKNVDNDKFVVSKRDLKIKDDLKKIHIPKKSN